MARCIGDNLWLSCVLICGMEESAEPKRRWVWGLRSPRLVPCAANALDTLLPSLSLPQEFIRIMKKTSLF